MGTLLEREETRVIIRTAEETVVPVQGEDAYVRAELIPDIGLGAS